MMARFIAKFSNSNSNSQGPTVSTISAFDAFHFSGNLILPIDERNIVEDYKHHSSMLRSKGEDHLATSPIVYVKYSNFDVSDLSNSFNNSIASWREYYQNIEEQLDELKSSDDDEERIDPGAIDTARNVLTQARAKRFAPPVLSWHGGDAVVMLWALSGSTYAVTITDGEVGYVIRRGRKELRSKDSIAVDKFLLEDIS